MREEESNSDRLFEAVEVLLVEDDEDDVFLIKTLFEEAAIANPLNVVKDGEAAMRYLRRIDEYSGVCIPDIVVLDLNLPGKDGGEVLAEMKKDPVLAEVPVVILTGTPTDAAILKAYHLNVTCYLTKPVTIAGLIDVVRKIPCFKLLLVNERTVPEES